MSLRRRVAATALVAALVVAVLGAVLIWRSLQVGRITTDVLAVFEPAAASAAQLELATSEMQRGLGAFLLTGDEEDLLPYVDGSRRSQLAVLSLDRVLSDSVGLARRVDRVAVDRAAWVNTVAQPAISAQRSGDADTALDLYNSDRAAAALTRLQTDAAGLSAAVNDRRTAGFRELADVTTILMWAVVGAIVILGASVLGMWFLVGRSVLDPLDDLRRQLRSVAHRGEHHTPIEPTGPPELLAVGNDAEEMRRQLVTEIDEAQGARDALDQKAPVVAAIRRELSAAGGLSQQGIIVRGDLRPAEGVLAGDWWDATRLPNGQVAVLLTDISGHGAEAGIAALRTKHTLTHGLISGQSAAEAVAASAEAFADEPGRFATTVVLLIDPLSDRLTWVNAGHHPPLLLLADGSVHRLQRTGPLLSWLGGQWVELTARFAVGDRVLLFSDGLVESHDADGVELGLDTVVEWLAAAGANADDPDELVQWLIGQARSRAVDWERDDVTVVAVARVAEGPAAAHQVAPASVPLDGVGGELP